jgi:ADP-ribosyl-[dinitrogen reductase] hydrolase
MSRNDCYVGTLLGTAVGDALGLPAEGLSSQRIKSRWPQGWKHRFLFNFGMVSDDTEHTVLVAQALIAAPRDSIAFQKSLARGLRWWFARLPAGVGLATARACIKLWLGFSPNRSGVFSARNGPAMRSANIGVFFADDAERRREFVRAATRLTHSDPKAEIAANAIAEAAAYAVRKNQPVTAFLSKIEGLSEDIEWRTLIHRLREAFAANEPVEMFATSLGLEDGITGYAYHTVPVALYAFLRNPKSFELALKSALDCGGDTDTVGAITGALAGTSLRPTCFPKNLD